MEFTVKFFDELTLDELYGILRARAQIFVVEQNCPYLDPDGLDQGSLHVFRMKDGLVDACLRAYPKAPGVVQMGRVMTLKHGTGLGGRLLRAGVREIEAAFAPQKIYIEAQTYAVGFYAREGFRVCSAPFTEDGIPHVGMELPLALSAAFVP